MTDVRKLLGRLNPTVCRFDTGRGGVPELTAQDIAAGLGMIPAGLGREIVCLVWWPDGARLSRDALYSEITRVIANERSRQLRNVEAARLAQHLAAAGSRDAMRAAAAAEESARAALWPNLSPKYRKVRDAVLSEIASPSLCTKCRGRGYTISRSGVHTACGHCEGRGSVPVSDRQRAAAIGVNETVYRRTWRGLYQYLYTACTDAEAAALAQLSRVLRSGDIAA
jgi:hypothetical protein